MVLQGCVALYGLFSFWVFLACLGAVSQVESHMPVKIVIDSREARSPVWQALHRASGLEVEVRELACGDYLPHPEYGIERKDATDFVLSIMDRRLFAQIKRLKDEYPRCAFLIEGNPYATRSGISPDAVRGAVSYIMAIEGVSLLMVSDASETAALLMTMARHLQEGLGYEPPLRGNKPKDSSDLSIFLVEGLPGIGASTARALLKHFGSAQKVFMASAAELASAPGVGKKTAERIRAALDYQV